MTRRQIQGDDEFRVHIGRADKGRSFLRVVHLPSGKSRIHTGLRREGSRAIIKRLTEELRTELRR